MPVIARRPQLPYELPQTALIRRLQRVPGKHGPQQIARPRIGQLPEQRQRQGKFRPARAEIQGREIVEQALRLAEMRSR